MHSLQLTPDVNGHTEPAWERACTSAHIANSMLWGHAVYDRIQDPQQKGLRKGKFGLACARLFFIFFN